MLAIVYWVVDCKKWWNGAPFLYAGKSLQKKVFSWKNPNSLESKLYTTSEKYYRVCIPLKLLLENLIINWWRSFKEFHNFLLRSGAVNN